MARSSQVVAGGSPSRLPSRLVFISGPRSGSEFPLGKREICLGRGRENGLVIPDISVSRRHAALRREGENHVVVDLGSGNGTRINGRAVQKATLKSGDEIALGDTVAVYVEAGEPFVPRRRALRWSRALAVFAPAVLAVAVFGAHSLWHFGNQAQEAQVAREGLPTATQIPTANSTPTPTSIANSTPTSTSIANSTPIPIPTATPTPIAISTPTATPTPIAISTPNSIAISTPNSMQIALLDDIEGPFPKPEPARVPATLAVDRAAPTSIERGRASGSRSGIRAQTAALRADAHRREEQRAPPERSTGATTGTGGNAAETTAQATPSERAAMAQDLYLRGYMNKSSDPESAQSDFRRVVDILPASDETARKARRWLNELAGDQKKEP